MWFHRLVLPLYYPYRWLVLQAFCDLYGFKDTVNSFALQWRHNERDCVSNHQPRDCLLNRLFRRRSKKPWKLRVTGLCAGNSPVTRESPAQRSSNVENVSIWWRHHDIFSYLDNKIISLWYIDHRLLRQYKLLVMDEGYFVIVDMN